MRGTIKCPHCGAPVLVEQDEALCRVCGHVWTPSETALETAAAAELAARRVELDGPFWFCAAMVVAATTAAGAALYLLHSTDTFTGGPISLNAPMLAIAVLLYGVLTVWALAGMALRWRGIAWGGWLFWAAIVVTFVGNVVLDVEARSTSEALTGLDLFVERSAYDQAAAASSGALGLTIVSFICLVLCSLTFASERVNESITERLRP